MALAQNALIAKGYTTTRILAAPRTPPAACSRSPVICPAASAKSALKVPMIRRAPPGALLGFKTNFRFQTAKSSICVRAGARFGKRSTRLPTAEADIRIEPGEALGTSDVVVLSAAAAFALPLALWVPMMRAAKPPANIRATSPLPPTTLRPERFVLCVRRARLGHKASYTDSAGHTTGSGSRSLALHYSAPFGNWLLAFNHNRYRYHQAVAGDSENYPTTTARVSTTDIGRLPPASIATSAAKAMPPSKLWKRESTALSTMPEISVQRPPTAGWQLRGFHTKKYLGAGQH